MELYTKGEVRSWYSPCPQSRQTLAAHHANGNFVIPARPRLQRGRSRMAFFTPTIILKKSIKQSILFKFVF
jgi:hypothetical protein